LQSEGEKVEHLRHSFARSDRSQPCMMMNYRPFFPLTFALTLLGCGNDSANAPKIAASSAIEDSLSGTAQLPPADTSATLQVKQVKSSKKKLPSSPPTSKKNPPLPTVPSLSSEDAAKFGFADIETIDPTIQLDIRYATVHNFTKAKIYDCPKCLLRPEAAEALKRAHKVLQNKGLRFKMFDCYRPGPYQQRLWDKVPNPDYVTPPAKGSMHSRGAAVDLTIVDAKGHELDMGTPYDFFGKEAHTDYTQLSATVQANRKLLRTTLEAVGFKGIRTEWWHFSYQTKDFPLSSYVWPCGK